MNYYLDTEFHEYKKNKITDTIELISIGLVNDKGREYYAISKDFNVKRAWKNEWLRTNVLIPILKELEAFDNHGKTNLTNNKSKWFLTDDGEYYKYNKTLREKVSYHFQNILNKIGIAKHNNTTGECVKDFGCCEHNTGRYWLRFKSNDCKRLQILINRYGKSNSEIASDIHKIVLEDNEDNNHFYTYYGDYDWVRFCWLYGRMIDLPKQYPMYSRDLKQIQDDYVARYYPSDSKLNRNEWLKSDVLYPKQDNEHNALSDAKWNKDLYHYLVMNMNKDLSNSRDTGYQNYNALNDE